MWEISFADVLLLLNGGRDDALFCGGYGVVSALLSH